jgi:hypothetical protein
MQHLLKASAAVLAVVFFALGALAQQAAAQAAKQTYPSFTIWETSHQRTRPLRDLAAEVRPGTGGAPAQPGGPGGSAGRAPDQGAEGAAPLAMTIGLNFDGHYELDGCNGTKEFLPDPSGAAGTSQYVQLSALCVSVYDKDSGALILGPYSLSTLFDNPSGCYQNMAGIVTFDKLAQRWLFALYGGNQGGNEAYFCFAVSASSDATGAYNTYAFSSPTGDALQQRLGVWPAAFSGAAQGAYLQSFLEDDRGQWVAVLACAYDRAAMLAGSTATGQCFQLASGAPALLPSDLDGTAAPPAGEPGLFVALDSSNDQLDLYELTPNFPSSGTFTGPTKIAVPAFIPYNIGNGDCGSDYIAQPYGPVCLYAFSEMPMYRLAYRNYGTKEALALNHTVMGTSNSAAVRWYEIDNPNGTPTVGQSGTISPDAENRWLGSTALDRFGDQAIGYSITGSSPTPLDPGLRVAARTPADAAGQMEPELKLVNGGYVVEPNGIYGLFSTMAVDPVDDCTFWYTGDYQENTNGIDFNTRVAKFWLPACTSGSLVGNGGFETGDFTSWTTSTGGCSPIVSTYKPHSGKYSAAEGATVHTTCPNASAWLKQQVAIPGYATSASLTFWYWPKTNNTTLSTNYLAVALLNTSGGLIKNLLFVNSNSQTWTTTTLNLSAYIGQTVVLYVPYYNNGGTLGGVYLDDFSLTIE